jgi:hypothetical protein
MEKILEYVSISRISGKIIKTMERAWWYRRSLVRISSGRPANLNEVSEFTAPPSIF